MGTCKTATAHAVGVDLYNVTRNDTGDRQTDVSRRHLEQMARQGYRVQGIDFDGLPFTIEPAPRGSA